MSATDRPVHVVVCDDADTRARRSWEAIERYAESDGGRPLSAIAWAHTAKAAIDRVEDSFHPDVVLVDLLLPLRRLGEPARIAAPWIARDLRRRWDEQSGVGGHSEPALVLWTANPLAPGTGCDTHAFMDLGGSHVIDKNLDDAEHVRILRAVADPDPERRETWSPPTSLPLTPREREVLVCMEAGLSTDTIAERLVIEPKSVEALRGRVRHAFGVPGSDGRGFAPLLEAARRWGYLWTPLRYTEPLGDPSAPDYDPFCKAI